MVKYYIKSIYNDYFSNKLTFTSNTSGIQYFDTVEDAEYALEMYGLVNCHVKSEEVK